MSGLDYLSRASKRKNGADLLLGTVTRPSPDISNIPATDETNMFGTFHPELDIDKLDAFPEHPFKVEMNQEVLELLNSAKQIGIHTPICVVPNPEAPGRYYIMYGHRRTYVAKKLGMKSIPGFVRDIDIALAKVIMSESNNLGRKNISPMEKARSYRQELIGLKELAKKGRRGLIGADNDIYDNVEALLDKLCEPGVTPRDIVAEKYGESGETIRRYVRLNALIPELQNLVDSGKLKFKAAVELSYLKEEEQQLVCAEIEATGKCPSPKQAAKLREQSESGSPVSLDAITTEEAQAKKKDAIPVIKLQLDYDVLTSMVGEDIIKNPETLKTRIYEALSISNERTLAFVQKAQNKER